MRLLLEGPDIEELLAQVRREHGGAARIVAADKVRSGGVAGFFARERYEVTVELDEQTDPAPAPTTLLELAAVVEDAERASGLSFQPLVAPPLREVPVHEAVVRDLPAPEVPVVSTESQGFAAVLRQLADDTADLDMGAPVPAGATMRAVAAAPITPARVGRHARPTTALETGNDVREGVSTEHVAAGLVPARDETEGAWAALGLPAELRPAPADGVPAVRLLRSALEQLPQAPRTPKGAGDVIVVAGPAVEAYQSAQEVAQRLRLDPASVLLAAATAAVPGVSAARRLLSAEDARRKLRTIRRNPHPTLIAVDADMQDGAAEWAREMADVLEADAVWAVIDATTKTADAAAHLRRLAPVQALLVRNARRTTDPGSVLSLGVPVAAIDGAAATPAAWASLLCERLLESA